MHLSLLRCLRCAFCGGTLNAWRAGQMESGADYDILTCHCGEYPVVAGIPIIKKDASGATTDGVNCLIKAGRYREALLSYDHAASACQS